MTSGPEHQNIFLGPSLFASALPCTGATLPPSRSTLAQTNTLGTKDLGSPNFTILQIGGELFLTNTTPCTMSTNVEGVGVIAPWQLLHHSTYHPCHLSTIALDTCTPAPIRARGFLHPGTRSLAPANACTTAHVQRSTYAPRPTLAAVQRCLSQGHYMQQCNSCLGAIDAMH